MPGREACGDLGDHSYFACLVVADASAYHAEAVAVGAELITPLADGPWGMREFRVGSVDGHRIMSGEELG